MHRQGRSVTDIATALRVSRATIYRHVASLQAATAAGR
jgi:AcrR family transcriptional regulator